MKGVHDVTKDGASEDKIYARLRELTDATRKVRKDLEELIRRPHGERTRGMAHDGRTREERTGAKPKRDPIPEE